MRVTSLTDADLAGALKRLADTERNVTLDLLLHLAEFDRRRLYLGAGFPSLFMYCRVEMLLSEQAAYHRIVAARAVRRHPSLAEHLRSGALNLSVLRLLAPHLTGENQEELVGEALHRSKREVEERLAARFPQPVRPAAIRTIPTRAHAGSTAGPGFRAAATATAIAVPNVAGASSGVPVAGKTTGAPVAGETTVPPLARTEESRPIAPPPPSGPPRLTPRAEDVYEFRFRGTSATRDKVQHVRDLLRHAVPDGNLDELMDRALDALTEKVERAKCAATERPRAGRAPAPGSRAIPAAVARTVWERDAGRCAFVSASGRRCGATAFMEFHHVEPHAVGGEATQGNIGLRCRAHNLYEVTLFTADREHLPSAGP